MPYDEPRKAEDIGSDTTVEPPRGDSRPANPPPRRAPEAPQANADGGASRADSAPPKRRSGRVWLILAIVVVVLAIGAGWYWYATKDEESTDDAYTDGRAITIAPQVNGYVVDLAVNDNEFVHAGQTIVRIDPRSYVAARDQAQGQLEAAQGQLAAAQAALDLARVTFPAKLLAAQAERDAALAVLSRADADLRRQHGVPRAATTQQDIDQATAGQRQAAAQVAEAGANLKQAEPVQENIAQVAAQVEQWDGQVKQAKAQLDQAELNLGFTNVTAPQDGWITKRNVERGNYVTAGAAITSLVGTQVWVTANFKESQLDRMRPGQQVRIAVDAYPGLKLTGHVDSVQLGSGAKFTAFPPENATGNFVKIVQRVPVKIDIDSGLDPHLPLPLGISVDPTVELK
jgi:membrane fusion protein (multidrug efflux system)